MSADLNFYQHSIFSYCHSAKHEAFVLTYVQYDGFILLKLKLSQSRWEHVDYQL